MTAGTHGRVQVARPRAALGVTERDEHGVREIAVKGDLDLGSAARLCLRLDAARRAPGRRVLLDLSRVTFCDSTGLRAVLGASHELAAAACALAVVVPHDSPVGRLLALTGLWEFLPVRKDRSGALRTLGAPAA